MWGAIALPVLSLTLEETSFSFVSKVLVACSELRPGKLAVRASLKCWASKGASGWRRGLTFGQSQLLNVLEFRCGLFFGVVFFFFPSPEIGINLLTTGFTAGYLDCVPYFSLMKT